MSRLHILQGISGTGKTSLAKKFAKIMGGGSCDIAVQAGWRDNQDLIGYYNSFEKKYYETEFLKGLYEAQSEYYKSKPYIILLDEMNLSHLEQYFADFLSALEKDPEEQLINLLSAASMQPPKKLIDGKKIQIPPNVWFIGTANHDETTMTFADKTYDRAHIMELTKHKKKYAGKKIKSEWSYEDLKSTFDKAKEKHKEKAKQVMDFLTNHIDPLLNEHFRTSWGSRRERQVNDFIPVVIAAGGTMELGMDHIMATKLFRKGKVTERYDTNQENLEALKKGLETGWKKQGFSNPPEESLALLDREIRRKKSGE